MDTALIIGVLLSLAFAGFIVYRIVRSDKSAGRNTGTGYTRPRDQNPL